MGKLTWKSLGAIYGGKQFGVTPEEAADVLSKYIFTDTTWKGGKNKVGRMWKDIDNRVALVCLVRAHQKFRTINRKTATKKLYNSAEFEMFCMTTNVVYRKYNNGFHRFQKDFVNWKQLPDVKNFYAKNDTYNKKAMKRVTKIVQKMKDVMADNERRMKAEGRIKMPDGSWKPNFNK